MDAHSLAMSVGHTFTVEHNGDHYVSVFPYAISDMQQTHTNEVDAWKHIIDTVGVGIITDRNWAIEPVPDHVAKVLFKDQLLAISAKHILFDDIQYSTMQFNGPLQTAISHAMRLFGRVSHIETIENGHVLFIGSYVVTITNVKH